MQCEITNRDNVRILAIEDEDLLREYVCDFLDDIGFETLQASNGREGLEMIRSEKPDLVLTDLRMPEMNGLDVLSTIQSEFPELPVIVISGTGTLSDVIQSMKYGAWDYILKPVHDYNILELSVNRVLERKRLLDENKKYREHLEEEVVKRTEELIKSTQSFKTLFNFAGDAIFIHDLQGTIIDFNQQAMDCSGYPRQELRNMNMEQLFIPEESGTFKENLKKLHVMSRAMYESVHLHRNGKTVPVEVHACMITMDDATPRILAICRDISERKNAEEERKQLEKQIVTSQKMESLGALASGIAHDFNNILAALNGYTILLRSKLQSGSGESLYLEKINDIITMGQNVTRRITTFIRKEKEELSKVNIHHVLSDIESLLRPNCHGISISLDLQAQEPDVLGDETQLQNMFLNLGINARDAMPSGGKLVFSTCNMSMPDMVSGEKVLGIRVTDTGTGMSKETVSRIFDPLFTTKERGKGTGLGLTSVLYCVKNLHGRIDVESTLGQGTVFQILFPVLRVQ